MITETGLGYKNESVVSGPGWPPGLSLGELLGGKKSRVLTACPSALPTPPQASVINGTSPFAHDYDLARIVAAYQERNGELWTSACRFLG